MGGQGTPKGPVMGGTWEENGYETSSHNGAPKIRSPWNKWFPYEPVPFSPKLGPYKVSCEAGQEYQFCTCGECVNQPWADGGECQPPFKPTPWVPMYTQTYYMNGSKHSSVPQFNGTCWLVWCDVNPVAASLAGFT